MMKYTDVMYFKEFAVIRRRPSGPPLLTARLLLHVDVAQPSLVLSSLPYLLETAKFANRCDVSYMKSIPSQST